ncbi:hypothetical protein ACE38V_19515 [Cytobacillus sp. Hz8]|uniref:hypothetical protein n=1 Tax=Cytobacillus sp. Hz8 TaxID=3347168 RepID=UPI0035D66CB9
MTKLTEDQFQMIGQYIDLLDTVEEAFSYILNSYENIELTAVNQLIGDIFSAFQQINKTNEQLFVLLKDKSSLVDDLQAFALVVEQAEKLDGVWNEPNAKQAVIREQLYPAFSAWKVMVQGQLRMVN